VRMRSACWLHASDHTHKGLRRGCGGLLLALSRHALACRLHASRLPAVHLCDELR
jgi:hypothetical protein